MTLTAFRLLLLTVFVSFVVLSGCAPTARFRFQKSVPKNAPSDFSKEVREEIAEDDKPVDPNAVLPSLSGSAVNSDDDRSLVSQEISKMIGTPYAYSGTDHNGIDCSGFTSKIYFALGKSLPHSAAEQYKLSKPVPRGSERFGDLVFFNTTGQIPSHVGIYLGGGYFAHASVSMGVTISSLESSYYRTRYIATHRLGK